MRTYLSPERASARAGLAGNNTSNVIVHQCVLDEGVEFLSKPYSLEHLSRRVREVLDKP